MAKPRNTVRDLANGQDSTFTVIEGGDGDHPYPSVAEMRASQRRGSEGCGLPENETGMLNEYQGHNVKIEEDE